MLEDIKSAKDNIEILFRKKLEEYPNFLENRELPHTILSIWQLIEKIDDVFDGMYLTAKNRNLYSFHALARVIIEYHMLSFFLVHEALYSKNDKTAEAYQVHLFTLEFLLKEMAFSEVDDLINQLDKKTGIIDHMKKKYPDLEKLTKEEQQEMSKKTKKLSIKEIIRYLSSEYSKPEFNINPEVVLNFLPDYAQLSTFIHGGPLSALLIKNMKRDKMEDDVTRQLLRTALIINTTVKQNFCMLLIPKYEDFISFYNETSKIKDHIISEKK